MSPLFVNAEGRGRNAPADRIAELRDYAQCVEYYLNNGPLERTFKEHVRLVALQARLAAYADLLSSDDPDQLLDAAISEAAAQFSFVKSATDQ